MKSNPEALQDKGRQLKTLRKTLGLTRAQRPMAGACVASQSRAVAGNRRQTRSGQGLDRERRRSDQRDLSSP